MNDYIRRLEKEKDMEQLVRRKMELEQLQGQSQLIDRMISQRENELSGVLQETEKRDINNIRLLEKALKKGSVLEQRVGDGMTRQQQSLLAEACLAEEGKARENILEDLKGRMQREAKELALKTDDAIQLLNKRKAQIIDEEEELIVKKATLEKLEERGCDFLVEVELGNAPPMELIVRNLGIDRDEVIQNAYENSTFNMKEVVDKSYAIVSNADRRLEALRREIQRGEAAIAAKDQYRHARTPLNPASKQVAAEVLDRVLKEVFKRITSYENWIDDLRSRSKYLIQKAKKANKEMAQTYNKRAIYEYP